jgi:hypothetical protein
MYIKEINLFYVHVPRSGGSSVEVAFGLKPPHEVVHRHKSAFQFIDLEKNVDLSNLRVFVTARNVFERLVSTFRYREVIAKTYSVEMANILFDEYIDAIYEFFISKGEADFYKNPACDKELATFTPSNEQSRYGNYCKGDKDGFIFNASHVRPLENWLGPFVDKAIYLNFSNYAKEFENKIINSLGIDGIKNITHYNKTPDWISDQITANPNTLKKIAEIYKWEIDKFSYTSEGIL